MTILSPQYAQFFPTHTVNAVAAHLQTAASNRQGIFSPVKWDGFGRKKSLAAEAQTLVDRYQRDQHTLGFVVGLIDLYRRDYFQTINARFAEVPASVMQKVKADYGSYSNGALQLYQAFTSAKYYPRDAAIYSVVRPGNLPHYTFLLNGGADVLNLNLFMIGSMSYDEAKKTPHFVSSVLIGALLVFAHEQGWTLELETEVDPLTRHYAQKFLRRARPFYLGANPQHIHGNNAHPFEAMYHDLFHLRILLHRYATILSFGEAHFQKQSRILQAVLAAFDEQGIDDFVSVFDGTSLLTGLSEGYDIEGDGLLSVIPDEEKNRFLPSFYQNYYRLFGVPALLAGRSRGMMVTV